MNRFPNTECNQIQPLLEAYALDALSLEERHRTEEHLSACEACSQIATDYAEIAVQLSEAVAGVSPHVVPDRLKGNLLDEIDRLSHREPIASPQAGPTTDFTEPGIDSISARTFEHRSGGWMRLAFALATALLTLSLIWSLRLNVTLARERALLAEYAGLVDQQEIVLEVIDSDKTERKVLLPVEDFPSRPYGKLFTRTDMNHVVAMAARLPDVPPDDAYHLWLSEGKETELVGVMNVNSDGFGMLVFDADADNPHYDSTQLTLQPVGTELPSENVIIRWDAKP